MSLFGMAVPGLATEGQAQQTRSLSLPFLPQHGQLGLYIDYSELAKITIRPPEYPMASEQDLEAMKAKYPVSHPCWCAGASAHASMEGCGCVEHAWRPSTQ